jgi:hypothetical protein
MLYKTIIILTLLLIAVSAIGELILPSRMLTFVGIVPSPQTNFLLQTTAVALLALLPNLWTALRNSNSPASRSALFGMAAYLFLSSIVDYYAHTQGIVNSMSVPSAVFRVSLGIVIIVLALNRQQAS